MEASFAACNEYASVGDVARGRSEFFHGKVNMLVVTERFHFYYRCVIPSCCAICAFGTSYVYVQIR
jgi:hypothetical protein